MIVIVSLDCWVLLPTAVPAAPGGQVGVLLAGDRYSLPL